MHWRQDLFLKICLQMWIFKSFSAGKSRWTLRKSFFLICVGEDFGRKIGLIFHETYKPAEFILNFSESSKKFWWDEKKQALFITLLKRFLSLNKGSKRFSGVCRWLGRFSFASHMCTHKYWFFFPLALTCKCWTLQNLV